MPEGNELAYILAGIRFAETGSIKGDYTKRAWYGGQEYRGAYGIPRNQWGPWSNFAGIRNAPLESEDAQDRVAATVLAEYYNVFGSWDMAIVAWFAGPAEANRLIEMGGIDALSDRSKVSAEYLSTVRSGSAEATENPEFTKQIHSDNLNLTKPGSAWINPVAGANEWSRGSYMPNRKTHRGRNHGAIDVYAEEGTPIVSPVAGTIVKVATGKIGGNTITIQGDDGIKYYFAHMASTSPRTAGQRINAGHHVGYVGNTGSARNTSPHLHMSMKYQNKVVNPATYLEQAAAFGYNDRAINAERAVAPLENPSNTPNQSMMTGWLQGLSNSMAGGSPELPPLTEIEAIRKGSQKDSADNEIVPQVAQPVGELEEADYIRDSRQGGPR